MWILFHAGLLIALGLSILFLGPVSINVNLFDIIPASRGLKAVAAADKVLGDKNSREVIILAGHTDFAQAKEGAELLYAELSGSPGTGRDIFESASLYVDETIIAQFTGFLHRYRYMLMDAETRRLLESGGAGVIAAEALGSAYGAFNFTSLDYLETDPFFLTERGIKQFLASSLLSSGAMSLRDDVLAASWEGTWYVMIRGTLAPRGVSLSNDDSGVEKIYAACSSITAKNSGIKFVYSGVPFHSYASSSNAQREISLISTITLIIIILLFLYVFRSPFPVLVSVFAAGLSIAAATAAALLFFREVHILTFVFGTTLIGTCVDYSIHFFIHWKVNRNIKKGNEIRSLILRGITLSFVSTGICFIALLFAPFVILKQFAIFSLFGLSGSFITITCLYPHFKMPLHKQHIPQFFRPVPVLLKRIALFSILAVSLLLLFLNRNSLRIENNISSLYTMPGFLMESERTASMVIDHGSTGWYFIVAGSTPEETLEREELLRNKLEAEIAGTNLGSYMAASLFIPSTKTQEKNYEAAEKLLPLAEDQFAYLGFSPETAGEFRRDFEEARNRPALPGGDIPPYLEEIISKLWIGRADETKGAYYSCVLPLHASNEERFRLIAEELEGVYFVNKVKDTGKELDSLTHIMLLLFLAAYVLIAIMIKLFYSWKTTLKICVIPLLLVLVSLTILACANIAVGFFSAVGLILVFGLGLDYMFYITESEKREDTQHSLTLLAIFLSYATTALSFGALALSSFVPVHIFGLTVFSGLTAAYISAMLLTGRDSSENQRISGPRAKGKHAASIHRSDSGLSPN